MVSKYTYLLPIIIFIWFPVTFIATYIMAVLREDVNPLFPYISDTGTFSPESCIFGQMLNTGAILMALLIYIRQRQVREICEIHILNEQINRRNKISAWFGFIAAFGVTIVGNFQETNILLVHMIGAFLAFGLGTIWACLQTWVSFQLGTAGCTRTTNIIRLILAVISSICFLISFVFAGLALLEFKGKDITKWSKQDGGYEYHLTSTITEWIVAFTTMGFVLSFSSELKYVAFKEPPIKIVSKHIVTVTDGRIGNHSSTSDSPRTRY